MLLETDRQLRNFSPPLWGTWMRARRPMLPVSCQSRRQGGAPLLSLAPPRYNPASLSMQGLQTAEAGATAHCPLATLVSTSRAAPRNPEPQSNDGGRWGWQPAEAGLDP
uniref:Uncharacterized protein n=1 Tax=Rousettus aegyptiacus TaxID=9407 RepID=A0A7J8FIP0_ROUAE|nr:hypothetical protein HJG63_012019 [Rousettus aegyptiacus]